jgi:large subunit ribosomal protein L22
MKASLTSHNQPPRKVRLVTDMVKGKTVQQALNELSFLPKRAAAPIHKLIASAAANATSKGAKLEDLRVENIMVDSAGMTVKYMPRAMGRAAPVRRRKSQVSVTLKDDSAS